MVKSKSFGARVFVVVNALVIGLLAASCLIPLIHVFAISLLRRGVYADVLRPAALRQKPGGQF